jgi:hypothetical protein
MSLTRSIYNAYQTAQERNWDTIYVLIDVHNTIAESNYKDSEVKFYPNAVESLKQLSNYPEVVLILWTCCYFDDGQRLVSRLKSLGINFQYINHTPVKNTLTGCFDKKPYFSVLFDDKAGFDPDNWRFVSYDFKNAREQFKLKKNKIL